VSFSTVPDFYISTLELDLKIPILSQLLIPISKELTVKGSAYIQRLIVPLFLLQNLRCIGTAPYVRKLRIFAKKSNSTNMQAINT
jgi:hypothetical protein